MSQPSNLTETLLNYSTNLYNQVKTYVFSPEHPQERFWQNNALASAILTAAEQKDHKKLMRILQQKKISLDTKIAGDSVIYKLSQKHDLITLKAVLSEQNYRKHIKAIACGQATAGRIDCCEKIIKKYAINNTEDIALAAARGGNYSYAESLLGNKRKGLKAMAARSGDFEYCYAHENTRGDIIAIAEGAAMGGWYLQVEELRQNYQLEMANIANMAALGGWIEYAELLYQQGQAEMSSIIEHAARGGHMKQISTLVRQHKVPVEKIVTGAASGGHHLYCLYQLARNPELLALITTTSAHYGYIDFTEYLRVHHRANINDISHGATLGGHSDYVKFLVEHHDADITNIALAAVTKNNHQEIMQALSLGANATQVLIAAINSQCQQAVSEVILRKLYAIDAHKVACVAIDNQQLALVKQMIPLYELCCERLVDHGLATNANTFVEMLREQGEVSTVFCACKALEYDNYDYLDYLKSCDIMPALSMAEAAAAMGKKAFIDTNYQEYMKYDMTFARLYLDYMLMGAVKAKDEDYVFELLGRGASKALAIFTAIRAQALPLMNKIMTDKDKVSTSHLWVANATTGCAKQRAELVKMLAQLENTESIG